MKYFIGGMIGGILTFIGSVFWVIVGIVLGVMSCTDRTRSRRSYEYDKEM